MAANYNQSYGAGTSVFFPEGIDGWHLKSQTPNESMSIDNITRDENGHYLTGSRHLGGNQAAYTEVWECDGDNSGAPEIEIGDIDDLICVESASLRCVNNDRPVLTITGHVHQKTETDSGNGHGDAKHIGDTFECTFAFPTGAYGAVNPFDGAGISTINDYEITESTQTFSINHSDEPGRTGEFLVGTSRGVVLTATMNLTTANTVTVGKASDGWAVTSKSSPATNEGVVKQTVSGSKYIDTSDDRST